jgi:hypothetical protein
MIDKSNIKIRSKDLRMPPDEMEPAGHSNAV